MPKDKIEELLLKAIEVALIQDKNNPTYNRDSSILVQAVGSDYYHTKYEPTKLMREIMQSIDYHKYLDILAQEVAEYIKNNYKDMIHTYIIEAFTKMLFNESREWDIKNFILSQFNNN